MRELFDAYAHCADRRDAEGQKALFTADTRFAVYMDGEGSEPTYVLEGREALTPVFADLNRYEVTTHFNGQSTVTIDGDRATGESYTIAHHVFTEDGDRKIMVASLRYLDTFAKIDGSWYFAERKLILDWSETRTTGMQEEDLMDKKQLSFARDIRPLFRDGDIQSMQSAFDLASYEDVRYTRGARFTRCSQPVRCLAMARGPRDDVQRFRVLARHGRAPLGDVWKKSLSVGTFSP